jgi:hypothetical protein
VPIVEPSGGSSGGSSGTVTDRMAVRLSALGLKGATWDNAATNSEGNRGAPTQQMAGTLAGFLNGDVVSNVWLQFAQAASGTAPAGAYVALYDTAGNQLAVSASIPSNAGWTAGTGYVAFPLASPYTFTATKAAYLCVLINGAWGTTQPLFDQGNNNGRELNTGFTVPSTVVQTGQATPPSPATFSASTFNLWMGWS